MELEAERADALPAVFTRINMHFVVSGIGLKDTHVKRAVDLSAEKRFTSNGSVVTEAIDALKTHGVGIKNAGMTVNRAQLDDLLGKYPEISEDSLDKLATKSPNGAIRKGISGTIPSSTSNGDSVRAMCCACRWSIAAGGLWVPCRWTTRSTEASTTRT